MGPPRAPQPSHTGLSVELVDDTARAATGAECFEFRGFGRIDETAGGHIRRLSRRPRGPQQSIACASDKEHDCVVAACLDSRGDHAGPWPLSQLPPHRLSSTPRPGLKLFSVQLGRRRWSGFWDGTRSDDQGDYDCCSGTPGSELCRVQGFDARGPWTGPHTPTNSDQASNALQSSHHGGARGGARGAGRGGEADAAGRGVSAGGGVGPMPPLADSRQVR